VAVHGMERGSPGLVRTRITVTVVDENLNEVSQ
jgi:hypothetical protein